MVGAAVEYKWKMATKIGWVCDVGLNEFDRHARCFCFCSCLFYSHFGKIHRCHLETQLSQVDGICTSAATKFEHATWLYFFFFNKTHQLVRGLAAIPRSIRINVAL